jgi:hypothetical protein
MKAPKYLTNHPAVQEVEDLTGQSNYRWCVVLRNAGGVTLNIDNRGDFEYANPIRVEAA